VERQQIDREFSLAAQVQGYFTERRFG
jgi:hypothetical protein